MSAFTLFECYHLFFYSIRFQHYILKAFEFWWFESCLDYHYFFILFFLKTCSIWLSMHLISHLSRLNSWGSLTFFLYYDERVKVRFLKKSLSKTRAQQRQRRRHNIVVPYVWMRVDLNLLRSISTVCFTWFRGFFASLTLLVRALLSLLNGSHSSQFIEDKVILVLLFWLSPTLSIPLFLRQKVKSLAKNYALIHYQQWNIYLYKDSESCETECLCGKNQ